MKNLRRIIFTLLLFFVMTIGVEAKYRRYEIGDVIEFNGHYFIVIEYSTVDDTTLKVIDGYELYVSNYQELKDTCGDGSTIGDIKCAAENAKICKSAGDDCRIVRMPFETEFEEGHTLEYNVERETNVGYFIENAALPYYKEVTGLNNLKVRLMTANEQIAVIRSYSLSQAGSLLTKYGDWNSRCGAPLRGGVDNGSNGETVAGEENYNWVYPNTAYWVDSLRYTCNCDQVVEVGGGQNTNTLRDATRTSAIRPVLEIDKREFAYPITTEKEGNGTLEVDTPDTEYSLGDVVYINEREWMVLGVENGEVRLIRTKPISISNETEVADKCGILLTSSSDVRNNVGPDMKEKLDCAFATMKYCKKENTGCHYIYLPYNYDNTDITYDESNENNVGHYVKNELNTYLESDFGLTNLRPTVMTYQEVQDLKDAYGRSNMFNSLPAPMGDEDDQILVPGALYPVLFRTGFIKDYTNYEGSYSTNYYNYVKPVVTLKLSDLPKIVKAGTNLQITTTPEHGYELSELKITTEDNETVTFTPESLTTRVASEYNFLMPGNVTKVFAKFIPSPRYNVTSLSEELVVENGENHLSGDTVKFRITAKAGYKLDKVVYYDENDKEIEVEVIEENGEYTVTVPEKDVKVKAMFTEIPPEPVVHKLSGTDVEIPVTEGTEGTKLTFTPKMKEKHIITGLKFTDGDGKTITPLYTESNGTYTIVMPDSDVVVSVIYYEEVEPEPTPTPEPEPTPVVPDEKDVPTPITGDSITRIIMMLSIALILFVRSIIYLKKMNKKKVLKPYDMV